MKSFAVAVCLLAGVLLAATSCADARQPAGGPQLQPYRDYVVPAQHWRLHESYELVYPPFGGLFGGRPRYAYRAVWVPMYPARDYR